MVRVTILAQCTGVKLRLYACVVQLGDFGGRGEGEMRNPSAIEKAELEYYLGLDLDSLWLLLGQAVGSREGAQYSPKTAMEKGRNWIDSVRKTLYEKICVKWNYCIKRNNERLKDRYVLGAAVGDLILTAIGGLPTLLVVSILMKMGLDDFCGCD